MSIEQKADPKGYKHPEKITPPGEKNVYKIFNVYKKPKKNEKFNSTRDLKQYTFQPPLESELCPICKSQAIIVCPCAYSDKKCDKSHVWYTDRDGIIKNGDPH